MRLSVNVPSIIAVLLFFAATLGSLGAAGINVIACISGGLMFLALSGLAIYTEHRG